MMFFMSKPIQGWILLMTVASVLAVEGTAPDATTPPRYAPQLQDVLLFDGGISLGSISTDHDEEGSRYWYAALAGASKLGGVAIPDSQPTTALLVKLDRDLQPQWAARPDPIVEEGSHVRVDEFGGVYVTGNAPIGSFSDAAIERRSQADGSLLWRAFLGGNDIDKVHGLATHEDGSAIMAARVSDGILVGGIPAPHYGNLDAALRQYDRDGNEEWTILAGGTGSDSITALATVPSGDIYFAGFGQDTVQIGNRILEPKFPDHPRYAFRRNSMPKENSFGLKGSNWTNGFPALAMMTSPPASYLSGFTPRRFSSLPLSTLCVRLRVDAQISRVAHSGFRGSLCADRSFCQLPKVVSFRGATPSCTLPR